MDYKIKDVMKKLNLTVHTVRHYCDMGLVPNLRYDKHGNRIFDEQSINWLKAASFLRSSGMAISEIKHYFDLCQQGNSTIDERYEIMFNLKLKTYEELKAMQVRMDCINEKVNHYQDIIAGKCEDDCNPLNW